jgi:hypothetical protein
MGSEKRRRAVMNLRGLVLVLCGCLVLAAGCGGDGPTSTAPSGHWEAIGHLNNIVYSMVIYNGDLIVGGMFTEAGGIAANHVARWDGDSWHALGDGVRYETGGVDIGYVKALAIFNGNLIVAGYFNEAGGVAAQRIAQWNGSAWTALGSGIPDDAYLHGPHCMAVYGGHLVVAGRFYEAGGIAVDHIAFWDGASWYATGEGVAGSAFTDILTLLVYDGSLVIGGSFTEAGGISASNMASWNGISWAAFGPGMNSIVESLLGYDGDLVAGGGFTEAGSLSANCIALWDGASWSALGSGMSGGAMGATSITSLTTYDADLIAGGAFTKAGDVDVGCIAGWDGSSWKKLGSGVSGGPYGLTSVLATVVYEEDLIVGGSFTSAGGEVAGFIAKWGE